MNKTLYIGILLFAGLAVGIFLTWPQYQDFQQVSFDLQEQEQALENKTAYLEELAKVKADLVKFREPFSKVEAALPLDPQLPALYDFLQTTAAFSGMSVRNISVSVQDQEQALLMRTIPVTLELTGSYGALKELISRLETASRMALVQSLNISLGQETERFSVTLQLNVYSY